MTLPTGTILLVRHAKAAGQEPNAALTPEGEQQAQALAQQLAPLGITQLLSSPWSRAVGTIRPLAEHLNLPIQTDARLTERVLSTVNLPLWQQALKAGFAAPALKLPGGESGSEAKSRIQAVLAEVAESGGVTVIVTHGNLLALGLGLDYAGWAALRNPDVWVYSPDGAARRYGEA